MSHVVENLAQLEQPEVEEALKSATRVTTLLDLVAAVADSSSSEEEVIATVKSLINSAR